MINDNSFNTAILPKAKYFSRNTNVNLVFLKVSDRADVSPSTISIPGIQLKMIEEIATSPKPLIVVVQGSRPLILTGIEPLADAILFAPGTGIATSESIIDLLFGEIVPSGRLSMTFPADAGQVPIYYNWTGTYPSSSMDEIVIDGYTPLYPFGYGLNYSEVTYDSLRVSPSVTRPGENVTITINVKNTGNFQATETIQCYFHDPVASRIQPYKKLVAYTRTLLEPGENKIISLTLSPEQLGFFKESNKYHLEKGKFVS